MGIFNLLFRKNDSLHDEQNFSLDEISTIETVSSNTEVVYPSGMLFKSVDSYIPNVDIMDVCVPIAMDVFKENYTVYSTEKLLSKTLSNLDLNISLRKEIYLINTGEPADLEAFKSMASTEICLLDNSFINKIANKDIDISDYIKIRKVLLDSFKAAGDSDPHFNAMHSIFSSRFLEYSDINKAISKLHALDEINNNSIKYESNLLYVYSLNTSSPTKDIMFIGNEKLKSLMAKNYNYDSLCIILSKTISTLHKSIQEGLNSYEFILSPSDYIYEVKKSIEKIDLILIDMMKLSKIDETTYLTLQEVLVEVFMEARIHDLYCEVISTELNTHIENNKFFKEYISYRIVDFFDK